MAQVHFKFPSIEQYRSTVKSVRDFCKKHDLKLPTYRFHGTVKLHGTNAAIVVDAREGGIYAQSRENIITQESDNAGFAKFVGREQFAVSILTNRVSRYLKHFGTYSHLVIYGEWCGQGIQKGVAISQLPKMFVIFAIRVVVDGGDKNEWFGHGDLKDLFENFDELDNDENDLNVLKNANIFCIEQFPTFDIDIDFKNPEASQNELVRITEGVERECPVADHFGVSGVGEGVVWAMASNYKLMFKVKGEKHSESKVKTLAEVDPEKLASIEAFVDYAVTEHRMEKLLDKLINEQSFVVDIKNTGTFIKTVCQDVYKEELDTITVSNFEWKEAASRVSSAAREWFLNKIPLYD